jgi:uroporphyrinogen decarboxylase
MTQRERVLTALRLEEPDRVPYMEFSIDPIFARKLMNWGDRVEALKNLEINPYSADQAKEIATFLHKDNIAYVLRAPIYAHKEKGKDGRVFYGDGLIKTEADLDMLDLPDPDDDTLYDAARAFAAEKSDFAACLVSRAGIFPTILSMGIETFSIALYENLPFVEELLDRYFNWTIAVAERINDLGFDIFVTTDDMAFKTGPYFSPDVFRTLVLPRYKRLEEKVSLPWIAHSDGNITPILDDFLSVGLAGIHPLENGAVDILAIKKNYGRRVCLLGNVDLNLLGNGTPEEVDEEVKGLIRDISPGGGYIVTSGNSLAAYCIPENVIAMAEAVQKYGKY